MILMEIRITYGKIKYKIKRWFHFNKVSRIIRVIKILDLKFSSFSRLFFKPKIIMLITLSDSLISEEDNNRLLKEIAAVNYLYGDLYFINYKDSGVNCRKLLNEYYLKLINGGRNND